MRLSGPFLIAIGLAATALIVSSQDGSCSKEDGTTCRTFEPTTTRLGEYSYDLLSSLLSFADKVLPAANLVPKSYALDLIGFIAPSFSWRGAFCDGEVRGCKDKKDFPGPQSYSQIGYHRVRDLISQMPRNEWSGKWWRGNELGTLINNPFFYASSINDSGLPTISPMSIGLGCTPKQHTVIRPIVESMFMLEKRSDAAAVAAYIVKSAEQLLEERKSEGTLNETDLKVWFHQVGNVLTFKREVTREYALKFIDVQGRFLSLLTSSQLFPAKVYKHDPLKMYALRDEVFAFVLEYKKLLEEQYSHMIEGKDCSPSIDCYFQTAWGVFDAFVAAGGVSVPSTTFQALAAVFSRHESNPAGPQGITYKPEQALQLHWEAIRIFPPVVVFQYWNPRPTCAGLSAEETAMLNKPNGETEACPLGKPDASTGYPKVNQYEGGMRGLPNVAIAQLDPDIWGEDAYKFRLRPLELYDNYSLGFAETAVDPDVADGKMDRKCPGKQLALLMGSTFLKMFNPDQWFVDPKEDIVIKTGGPYVKEFNIYLKAKKKNCAKVLCDCEDNARLLQKWRCSRCVSQKCSAN